MTATSVGDSLLLTREDLQSELKQFVRDDLRAELKHFMEVSFAAELRQLGAQTYKDFQENVQGLLASASQSRMPRGGSSDGGGDVLRISSLEIPTFSPDVTSHQEGFVSVVPGEPLLPGSTANDLESPENLISLEDCDYESEAEMTVSRVLSATRLRSDTWRNKEPRLRNHQQVRYDGIIHRMRDTVRATASFMHSEPDWQHLVKIIVKDDNFDYIMGVFLIANALSIGAQTNHMANQDSAVVPTGFRLLMGLFCIVFTVELGMRVACHGKVFFTTKMKGWQWNAFDILVVTIQIIDELTQIILAGAGGDSGVLDNAGALRILRIFRVVRLIRMVRLIPELKNMVYLIFASMWSFVWTAVLLLLMMYVFAVYYTEISTDLRHDHGEDGFNIPEIQENWGSLGASMFSLFMAITGGDDWYNFVKVFQGHAYFLHTMIFCGYVGFAVLVMLNLVTGVFVEGAQRIVQEDKDNELVRRACVLFDEADMDGTHYITWERFNEQLESDAMADYFAAVDLNMDEAKALFQLLDTDDSGSLTIDEFVQGCLRLKGPARSVDLASLVLDLKNQMRIQREQWEEVEQRLGRVGADVHRVVKRLTVAPQETSRPPTGIAKHSNN